MPSWCAEREPQRTVRLLGRESTLQQVGPIARERLGPGERRIGRQTPPIIEGLERDVSFRRLRSRQPFPFAATHHMSNSAATQSFHATLPLTTLRIDSIGAL